MHSLTHSVAGRFLPRSRPIFDIRVNAPAPVVLRRANPTSCKAKKKKAEESEPEPEPEIEPAQAKKKKVKKPEPEPELEPEPEPEIEPAQAKKKRAKKPEPEPEPEPKIEPAQAKKGKAKEPEPEPEPEPEIEPAQAKKKKAKKPEAEPEPEPEIEPAQIESAGNERVPYSWEASIKPDYIDSENIGEKAYNEFHRTAEVIYKRKYERRSLEHRARGIHLHTRAIGANRYANVRAVSGLMAEIEKEDYMLEENAPRHIASWSRAEIRFEKDFEAFDAFLRETLPISEPYGLE
eukprot:gene28395-31531_t